jgi:ribosomal protein S18 acetylase RimI-like enzyme
MDSAASSSEDEARQQQREGRGEVLIRPAENGDAPALAELMGELGYPTRTAEMEMRLDTILRHPGYRTFVAIADGAVAGMIGTVIMLTHEHNSPGGRIIALVVSEKSRGRGVGRTLMAAAESDFAARNIRRIALNTRFHREQAHLFYEGLGYSKNGFRFVKELDQLAD